MRESQHNKAGQAATGANTAAPRSGRFRQLLGTSADIYGADWWRHALIMLIASVLTAVAAILAVSALSGLAFLQRDLVLEDGLMSQSGILIVFLEIAIPTAILLALLAATCYGAVAALTELRASKRDADIASALAQGLKNLRELLRLLCSGC